MSICVLHPNFGCLIRHCALFRQNASGVYVSGPGPWEVSLASSGTLRIMTTGQVTPRRRIEKKTTSQSSAKAPSYTMGAVRLNAGPLPINNRNNLDVRVHPRPGTCYVLVLMEL